MKLSFSTLACPEWSFEEIIRNAERMGYDAVEVRGVGNQLRSEKIDCMLPENRAETRRLLAENGVKLCVIGTSVCLHDAGGYEQAIEEGRRALELCTELDIPFIRVFGNDLPADEDRETVIRRVAGGIAELCEYSASLRPERPVRVLLEVHGDFNTLPILKQVCDAQKRTACFGLIWDMENSYFWHGDRFEAFYETLKPYIFHIHVKNCVMKDGKPLPCMPEEGILPLRTMLEYVLRDGYDGYFSFEWEKRWHPEIRAAEEVLPEYVEFMHTLENR